VPDAFTSNNTNRAWDSGRQQSLAEWKSKADLIQVKKQLWQAVDAEANARKAAVEEARVDQHCLAGSSSRGHSFAKQDIAGPPTSTHGHSFGKQARAVERGPPSFFIKRESAQVSPQQNSTGYQVTREKAKQVKTLFRYTYEQCQQKGLLERLEEERLAQNISEQHWETQVVVEDKNGTAVDTRSTILRESLFREFCPVTVLLKEVAMEEEYSDEGDEDNKYWEEHPIKGSPEQDEQHLNNTHVHNNERHLVHSRMRGASLTRNLKSTMHADLIQNNRPNATLQNLKGLTHAGGNGWSRVTKAIEFVKSARLTTARRTIRPQQGPPKEFSYLHGPEHIEGGMLVLGDPMDLGSSRRDVPIRPRMSLWGHTAEHAVEHQETSLKVRQEKAQWPYSGFRHFADSSTPPHKNAKADPSGTLRRRSVKFADGSGQSPGCSTAAGVGQDQQEPIPFWSTDSEHEIVRSMRRVEW